MVALSQDGRDRSLHWGINSIVKVDDRVANSTYVARDEDGQTRLVRRVATLAGRQETQLGHGRGVPAPWLVTLKDELEAKRFVRAWNQRAFPMSNEIASGEPLSVVKAELVW
ncbi:MAG: hypothetical protein M1839_004852 [Geoglossum umbratile]|nr:MAG: hypothetical protein M1839_004852 [Geoglossum umbratile]